MAKLTEKKLFETCIDIHYAHQLNKQFLHDFEIEIKELKKHCRKTKAALKTAIEHYKKVYKKEPTLLK